MGILDKLRSMGIGVKSPYEIERDANPGMNQFRSRGGAASYEDIKQQEALNRQAGVNLKRYQGNLKSGEKVRNIYGVSYVVPAGGGSGYDTPSPTPAATSYSNDFESAGGPVPRGMFSNPLVQNEEVPYYLRSPEEEVPYYLRSPETDSVRQAVQDYGGGMMPYEGQDQTANNNRVQRGEVTPQEYVDNAAKTWGVHPSNFVAPGDNFQNQGKPEPIPSWIDAMNERFAGNRQAELPDFFDSMFSNQFPEGISKSLFTPNPQSITNNVPENQKNALIDTYNTFSGDIPQGKYNVPDEVPFDPVAAQIRTEKANLKAEMISERTDPETAMYGAAVVTPEEVDREYAIRKNIQSYKEQQPAPEKTIASNPSVVTAAAKDYINPDVLAYGGGPEVLQSSRATPVDRVYDLRKQADRTAMSKEGKLFAGEDAVTAVKKLLKRDLSYAEQQIVREEGFSSSTYLDSSGHTTIGVGLTKQYYTDDPEKIGANFEKAMADKVAKNKKDFGANYPKDEKKQAALLSLAYRGDVGPKWAKHFKEGRTKEAQQELWNNNEYRELLQKESKSGKEDSILKRVRKNEEVLFGRKTIIPFKVRK